ncbi:hypothetical protein LEP1GSC125_1372 [Leptospira mayottensis 200901122]|uniref:Uncharacterized protein n=1 Tax=Leptospira mayottensis 200901122 TaxID=1193010 RepID=A0AA87MNE3_9LEPT|nr:hypothetical protein LEP1GSC125_1372 [Leptospira mayottensis 200901122]
MFYMFLFDLKLYRIEEVAKISRRNFRFLLILRSRQIEGSIVLIMLVSSFVL